MQYDQHVWAWRMQFRLEHLNEVWVSNLDFFQGPTEDAINAYTSEILKMADSRGLKLIFEHANETRH